MKYNLWLVSFLVSFCFSCEKLLIEADEQNTPRNNFDQLWESLDKGYVYFDYKNIDWDSIRMTYAPLIDDQMSENELFETLADMLETLKDGHTSIRKNIMESRTYDVTQAYDANFNKEFVISNYLSPNDFDTTTFIRHCFLKEDIGYLYYSTFTNEITEKGMNEIITKYADTKGMIFDVRGNMGGDASNFKQLMSHFVNTSIRVGYSQEKIGEGHSDLNEPRDLVMTPADLIYTKPIIVLANRSCYSACNAFVAFMSLLPNVIILGDRTGGGAGLPIANQLWNGWYYTYSATVGGMYLYENSLTEPSETLIIEDGIDPDIFQSTNESNEADGLDLIIERALIELQ